MSTVVCESHTLARLTMASVSGMAIGTACSRPGISFQNRHALTGSPLAQGAEQLDDEGAAAVASLMASARGVGAPATSPLDYKKVTPAVMAGVWEVPLPPPPIYVTDICPHRAGDCTRS